ARSSPRSVLHRLLLGSDVAAVCWRRNECAVDRRAGGAGFVGEGIAIRQITVADRRLLFDRCRYLVAVPHLSDAGQRAVPLQSSESRKQNSQHSSVCTYSDTKSHRTQRTFADVRT